MIPGLLAASGYDRDDTNYQVSTIESGLGVWNNSALNARTMTCQKTASQSRWVLVGVSFFQQALSPQTTTVDDILINGESVSGFISHEVNYNTNSNYRIMQGMGYARIPTGTTYDLLPVISSTAHAGAWVPYGVEVDFGVNPITVASGSDSTPSGTGVLEVADMGQKSTALVLATWEDSADTQASTTIDVDPNSESLDRNQRDSALVASTTFFTQAVSLDGDHRDTFPIELTPNTYTASDEAVLMYIAAGF